MSLFDKIKNIVNVPEDEDYGYDDGMDGDMDYGQEDNGLDDSYGSSSGRYDSSRYDSYGSSSASSSSYGSDKQRSKVVNMHGGGALQVVLVKPERFDDAPSVADHLNAKRTVVLNLESASKETSRRLIDFLSGVAYANKGQIKRVANSTFIITPYDVDVMGDLILDELENSSAYL
ncbi:MAG: cell division protein SepF [Clostridiales bacterium]|nr:cell division protein SepF [Clostridiales bacterium]